MQFKVIRQACCSADDQAGPLDAVFELDGDASFGELVAQIITAGFLQFSSSHNRLSCELEERCLVEIFAPGGLPPLFHIDPQQRADAVVGERTLFCYFRHL